MGLFNRKKPEMVVCPECSQLNPRDAETCDMCGADLRQPVTAGAPTEHAER
jgi:ribosomal protein L40E